MVPRWDAEQVDPLLKVMRIGHSETANFCCSLFSKELFFVQDFNQMQRTLCKACRTFWIWNMNLWSQELPIPCYTSGAADGWVVYLEWIRGGFVGAHRSNCAQRPRKWWDRASPSTFLAFGSGFPQVCWMGLSDFKIRDREIRNLETTESTNF